MYIYGLHIYLFHKNMESLYINPKTRFNQFACAAKNIFQSHLENVSKLLTIRKKKISIFWFFSQSIETEAIYCWSEVMQMI